MTTHKVPPPTSQRFDYAAWLRPRLSSGDTVVFPTQAAYWTEWHRQEDFPRHTVIGNSVRFLSKLAPPPPINGVWRAPFDIIGGEPGTEIFDLYTQGPKPAGTSFDVRYEGQHGFAFHGAKDVILCRCGSAGMYGDHVYVSGGTSNLIVCDFRGATQSGRHGVSTVDAEDVLIFGGEINALRTGLNFEVHQGQKVERYHAEGVKLGWTLRAITGTGEGDASDVAFRNLRGAGTHKLSVEVYGTGQQGTRAYGKRTNWTLDGFTNVRTPTSNAAYKLHFVDGLTLRNLPPYPPSTIGSTLL